MDKKLLDALNNLSFALQEISDIMSKKGDDNKSATSTALTSANIDKKLDMIDKGVKKLAEDNKKILKNQETIIALSKKKDNQSMGFDAAADPNKKGIVKDGLAVIMLIAVGILAVGLAFKIIGKVDFVSVIALSIALPLIALAFEKIKNAKITIREAATVSGVLAIASAALVAASYILSYIRPVSFLQILTAIGLSAAFYFILPAISGVISSMTTSNEVGIGPFKKTVKSLSFGAVLAGVVVLPLLMIGASFGIVAASYILANVRPVGFFQLLTAIGISAAFYFIGGAVASIITALTTSGKESVMGKQAEKKGLTPGQIVAGVLLLPIVMIATSIGIVASSYILSGVKPIGILQAITAILIAGMFAVIGFSLGSILKSFKDIDPATATKASLLMPLIFVAMAAAITASSWVMQLIMPVGFKQVLTAIAISIMFVVLSYAVGPLMKGIKGVAYEDMAKGVLVMLALTGAVVLASQMVVYLAPLSFEQMIRLVLFSIASIASVLILGLGVFILNKFVKPEDAIQGGITMVILAGVIVLTSLILSLGDYSTYPPFMWSLGVALSIGLFGIGAILLGTQAANPFFYAGLGLILLVAGTIVAASYVLSVGTYDTYPSPSWALGVGLSLGFFGLGAVLLGINVLNPFFYAGLEIITTVAETIVAVSYIFSNGKYETYPPAKWVVPVTALMATLSFAIAGLGIIAPLIGVGALAAFSVIEIIKKADKLFSTGGFKSYPSEDWVKGSTFAIKEYGKLSSDLASSWSVSGIVGGLFNTLGLSDDVSSIIDKIVEVDEKFSRGNFTKYPSVAFMDGIYNAVVKFVEIQKYIDSNVGIFESIGSGGKILQISTGIEMLGNSLSSVANQLNNIDIAKLNALKTLSGSIVLLSLMDPAQFDVVMDSLDKKGRVLSDVINQLESTDIKTTVQVKTPGGASQPTKTMDDLFSVMTSIDARLSAISTSSNNISNFVNEHRAGSNIDLKN